MPRVYNPTTVQSAGCWFLMSLFDLRIWLNSLNKIWISKFYTVSRECIWIFQKSLNVCECWGHRHSSPSSSKLPLLCPWAKCYLLQGCCIITDPVLWSQPPNKLGYLKRRISLCLNVFVTNKGYCFLTQYYTHFLEIKKLSVIFWNHFEQKRLKHPY